MSYDAAVARVGRRLLQQPNVSLSDGSNEIPNPLMCLELGEMIVFRLWLDQVSEYNAPCQACQVYPFWGRLSSFYHFYPFVNTSTRFWDSNFHKNVVVVFTGTIRDCGKFWRQASFSPINTIVVTCPRDLHHLNKAARNSLTTRCFLVVLFSSSLVDSMSWLFW